MYKYALTFCAIKPAQLPGNSFVTIRGGYFAQQSLSCASGRASQRITALSTSKWSKRRTSRIFLPYFLSSQFGGKIPDRRGPFTLARHDYLLNATTTPRSHQAQAYSLLPARELCLRPTRSPMSSHRPAT